MSVKEAIEAGDSAALREMFTASPELADELIVWGKDCEIRTHPLHYVSDVSFTEKLSSESAVELVETLLRAGANVNFVAANGETALIGAASLHAEQVGLRLIAAGANINSRGVFEETALHWAAHEGQCLLVEALVAAGADLTLKDKQYMATPLEWAEHGGKAQAAELLKAAVAK